MNLEKVVFGFFIVSALSLNFGFFVGDVADPSQHHVYELYAAIVVSLIATVLKFGDRSQMGAVLLSTSLVADLQLVTAAIVWGLLSTADGSVSPTVMASVVSLSGGALIANIVSVIILIAETLMLRH